ncbi:MAG: LysR family transcriptional regulator [Candidatus Ventricola sp.]|nr:LysR family transcriptional regulator [Candidatus Ventricola sp.]
MTTEHLYEFLILSKLRSYSQAARELFISQSILTRHIQEMERELQAQLFVRTTHGVTLTQAGRLFAARTEALLEDCARATHQFSDDIPAAGRGQLRIACSLEISYADHIRLFVSRFMERSHDVQLTFDVIPDSMPAELLSRYDIVISPCRYLDLPMGVRSQLIHSHSTYAIIPAGHRLMGHSVLSIRSLEDETILVPYADELFGPYAQNWQAIERVLGGRVRCRPVKNATSAIALTVMGQGILIGPRYLRNLLPSVNSSSTVCIGISDRTCRFPEYIYCPAYLENGTAHVFYEEFVGEFL